MVLVFFQVQGSGIDSVMAERKDCRWPISFLGGKTISRMLRFVALATIVLGAGGLAVYWVFLVPIYQAPDEPEHLDYALAINEHGGLFCGQGMSFYDLPGSVHPYTCYLAEKTHTLEVVFRGKVKMSPEYGTLGFFTEVDRGAPSRESLRIDTPNHLFAVYPFGYYATLAAWIECLHLYSDKPVFIFFGARLLSVLLFTFTLVVVHATGILLRLRPWLALVLTACIGFFPLTSFVASSIQPDNLSFFLVSLSFYLALLARRHPAREWIKALLGLALGALLVTKIHFWLCVAVPIGLMLATAQSDKVVSMVRKLRGGILLLAPTIVLGSVHLWATWGTTSYYHPPAQADNLLVHKLDIVKAAFLDYYSGNTHQSFWGIFGWMDTPLIIRDPGTTAQINFVIQAFAWIILALTLLRLEQVCSRLLRLAWKGRLRQALRIAFSNPLINSYFLFTVFMFGLYVWLENLFGAQGRHWWPLLLPIFLVGIVYAPKALTLRGSRAVFSRIVIVGLVLFCVLGSFNSLRTIRHRYYWGEHKLQRLLEGRNQFDKG